MTYELRCIYDSRQSFYGRANVRIEGSKHILISYSTIVAVINTDDNTVVVYGTYSQTTLRHIKEFLKQGGFKADTKSQIERDYMQ